MNKFLCALGVLLSITSFASFTSSGSQRGVQVLDLEGEVRYGAKRVAGGDLLFPGKLLQAVGEKSFVDFQFPEGSKIRLRNGSMRIEKLGKEDATLSLKKGTSFAHVKKVAKGRPRKLRIRTRISTLGVRGTKFFVQELPEQKKSYLCVCEGKVVMEKDGKRVPVKAGEDLWAEKGKALGKPKPATDMMWTNATREFEKMGVPVRKARRR